MSIFIIITLATWFFPHHRQRNSPSFASKNIFQSTSVDSSLYDLLVSHVFNRHASLLRWRSPPWQSTCPVSVSLFLSLLIYFEMFFFRGMFENKRLFSFQSRCFCFWHFVLLLWYPRGLLWAVGYGREVEDRATLVFTRVSPALSGGGFIEYPDKYPVGILSHIWWKIFGRQNVYPATKAIACRSLPARPKLTWKV